MTDKYELPRINDIRAALAELDRRDAAAGELDRVRRTQATIGKVLRGEIVEDKMFDDFDSEDEDEVPNEEPMDLSSVGDQEEAKVKTSESMLICSGGEVNDEHGRAIAEAIAKNKISEGDIGRLFEEGHVQHVQWRQLSARGVFNLCKALAKEDLREEQSVNAIKRALYPAVLSLSNSAAASKTAEEDAEVDFTHVLKDEVLVEVHLTLRGFMTPEGRAQTASSIADAVLDSFGQHYPSGEEAIDTLLSEALLMTCGRTAASKRFATLALSKQCDQGMLRAVAEVTKDLFGPGGAVGDVQNQPLYSSLARYIATSGKGAAASCQPVILRILRQLPHEIPSPSVHSSLLVAAQCHRGLLAAKLAAEINMRMPK